MRRQERVGVVAVHDGGDVEAGVGDRRAIGLSVASVGTLQRTSPTRGFLSLLAAEVGVAEVVDGGEESETLSASAPMAIFPRRACEHLPALQRCKDGEDRKRRQDHTVGEPVEHAAPGDRGGELEAARVRRRRLVEDDRHHDSGEGKAEHQPMRQLCVSTARGESR